MTLDEVARYLLAERFTPTTTSPTPAWRRRQHPGVPNTDPDVVCAYRRALLLAAVNDHERRTRQ